MIRGDLWEKDFNFFYDYNIKRKNSEYIDKDIFEYDLYPTDEKKFLWLYEIIVNFKRLQNILTNDYEMCLHHNNSTMHFITSDNPVIKLQDEHIAKTPFCNFLSGGCSCRDIMLLFPLTPDNLLVLEHKKTWED